MEQHSVHSSPIENDPEPESGESLDSLDDIIFSEDEPKSKLKKHRRRLHQSKQKKCRRHSHQSSYSDSMDDFVISDDEIESKSQKRKQRHHKNKNNNNKQLIKDFRYSIKQVACALVDAANAMQELLSE